MKGLEPPRPEAQDPKSCSATNYDTSAKSGAKLVNNTKYQKRNVKLPPEFEVLTEIDVPYLFIISKLSRCPLLQYLPLEEKIGSVCD